MAFLKKITHLKKLLSDFEKLNDKLGDKSPYHDLLQRIRNLNPLLDEAEKKTPDTPKNELGLTEEQVTDKLNDFFESFDQITVTVDGEPVHVQVPYFMNYRGNDHEDGWDGATVTAGKGTPKELREWLQDQIDNGKTSAKDPGSLRKYMKDNEMGVDCSGFVSQALNHLADKEGDMDYGSDDAFKPDMTGSGSLKGGANDFKKISPDSVKAGDTLFYDNKSGVDHIQIVADTKKEDDVLYYTIFESSGSTGPRKKDWKYENGQLYRLDGDKWRAKKNQHFGRWSKLDMDVPSGGDVVTDGGDDDNNDNPTQASSTLSASVGEGGVNKEADTLLVQQLLNKHGAGIAEDGDCGPITIGAIKDFQKDTVGFNNPDGRVDVGGTTWAALAKGQTTPTNDDSQQEDDDSNEDNTSSSDNNDGQIYEAAEKAEEVGLGMAEEQHYKPGYAGPDGYWVPPEYKQKIPAGEKIPDNLPQPTWCNRFAFDLAEEVLGEDSPFKDMNINMTSADGMNKFFNEHDDLFEEVDTFEKAWEEANKGKMVFLSDSGHVATCVPTDKMETRVDKQGRSWTFGEVIQAGASVGKMYLNYAWNVDDFANIEVFVTKNNGEATANPNNDDTSDDNADDTSNQDSNDNDDGSFFDDVVDTVSDVVEDVVDGVKDVVDDVVDFFDGDDPQVGKTIKKSVGNDGENEEEDVRVVQALLNKHGAGIAVDGDCGPITIGAIEDFQKNKVGFGNPDGRVDVGGTTWKALAGEASPSSGTDDNDDDTTDTPDIDLDQEVEEALSPTSKISASVGKGGKNKEADVLRVKQLLNKFGYKLEENGESDSALIAAIEDFQSKYRQMNNPDGRVDAGGGTWGSLLGIGRIQGNLGKMSEAYGVEPAVILAIQKIESGANGFFSDGRPKILFEGHVFWRQLVAMGKDPQQYRSGNEDILYPEQDRSKYEGGTKEYDRLERAKKIDEVAALKSASWGEFQIMGFNHSLVGYSDVKSFVEAMHIPNGSSLKAVMEFVKNRKLLKYVQGENKNWADFAEGYNGSGYWKNKYDEKLAAAYEKFSEIDF